MIEKTKKCQICGKEYKTEARNSKYCKECSKEFRKLKYRKKVEETLEKLPERKCIYCGELFKPQKPSQKYCSDECKCFAFYRNKKLYNEKYYKDVTIYKRKERKMNKQ